MPHYNEHAKTLLTSVAFPGESVAEFTRVLKRLDSEQKFGKAIDRETHGYMFPWASNLDGRLKNVDKIAEEFGENNFTLEMVFLMLCSEKLHERYEKKGISDDIFYATMDDLRCKNRECMECKSVWGTFVGSWFGGFFEMNRFALGRFQYESTKFDRKEGYMTKCGYEIKHGEKIHGFHIPSSGVSLTDEVRLDSYKRAYEFYKPELGEKPLVLACGSWLLYPSHREFLPAESNILRFMDDFEMVCSEETEKFNNDWRIYGADADKELQELPEKTALQRAYKQWLLSGRKAGSGYGVIIFDGEKILR